MNLFLVPVQADILQYEAYEGVQNLAEQACFMH